MTSNRSRSPLTKRLAWDYATTRPCRRWEASVADRSAVSLQRDGARQSTESKGLDDEHERLVRGDDAATCAVGHGGRDRELPAPTDLHPLDAGVPARDHLALAELEFERSPTTVPRRVELLARGERDSDVVNRDLVAARGLRAVADDDVLDSEVERDVAFRLVDLRTLE